MMLEQNNPGNKMQDSVMRESSFIRKKNESAEMPTVTKISAHP